MKRIGCQYDLSMVNELPRRRCTSGRTTDDQAGPARSQDHRSRSATTAGALPAPSCLPAMQAKTTKLPLTTVVLYI